MPKQQLDYGPYRRVTFAENPVAWASKRFIHTQTGETISGAQARKLAGSTAPSRLTKAEKLASTSGTHDNIIKGVPEKKMSIPTPSKVGGIEIKGKRGRLKEYNTRVKSFSATRGMDIKETKSSKYFQQLNKETTSQRAKLDKLENKLKQSLKEKGFLLGDKLDQNAYVSLSEKIASSNLSAKEKEKLFNQMNKIRDLRDRIGDLYRKIGIKDANDFTAFGDTPEI